MNKCIIKTIHPNNIEAKIVKTGVTVSLNDSTDYASFTGKPFINGHILQSGNNTSETLGIVEDKNFVYEQIFSLSVWNIAHNLNKYPSVTVVDSANTVVMGDIQYIDRNSLSITFSAPFTGFAYLN